MNFSFFNSLIFMLVLQAACALQLRNLCRFTSFRSTLRIVSGGAASIIATTVLDGTQFIESDLMQKHNDYAFARNLPESTGASGAQRGQTSALLPILKMNSALKEVCDAVQGDLSIVQQILMKKSIPAEEKDFKRLFDEYSEGISYKQQYLDKNAFLVYYTKGFDGPNRSSIETEDDQMKLQKAQYGFRNDAWVAVDDARAEVAYLIEQQKTTDKIDRSDLNDALNRATIALKNYIELAPKEQVAEGVKLLTQ